VENIGYFSGVILLVGLMLLLFVAKPKRRQEASDKKVLKQDKYEEFARNKMGDILDRIRQGQSLRGNVSLFSDIAYNVAYPPPDMIPGIVDRLNNWLRIKIERDDTPGRLLSTHTLKVEVVSTVTDRQMNTKQDIIRFVYCPEGETGDCGTEGGSRIFEP
jgi:hypothetical protein